MISKQTSANNMVLVQDSVLGVYFLCKENPEIDRDLFFDIISSCEDSSEKLYSTDFILKNIERISSVLNGVKNDKTSNLKNELKNIKTNVFSGQGLLSMILPENFNYKQKLSNSIDYMEIFDGVILSGYFDKKVLGSSKNTIIQVLYKEYGPAAGANFINNLQRISNQWLDNRGFSIGLKDCVPKNIDLIEKSIISCMTNAERIKDTAFNNNVKELKIGAVLSGARDIGQKIAQDEMNKGNRFMDTINSGSKGDVFNITQITASLGQQCIKGKRPQYSLYHNTRALPHYSMSKPLSLQEEYESKGFVINSFSKGLTPRQYYSHSLSGRQGIVNTSMSTSSSGYTQRKSVQLMKDTFIEQDMTVRNKYGTLFQTAYSGDGYDRSEMVQLKNGKMDCMDISRIVDRLNLEYTKEKST